MQPQATRSASPAPARNVSPGAAPAVSRAIAILRLLGKSDAPLGVSTIAARLGMVPSSCLHILRVLVAEELVTVDPVSKQYRLDAGILTLARSVLRPGNFAQLVQPALNRISHAWQVTAVAVQVVSLDHIVVVAISESRLPMRIHVEMGSRFPALMSATGRCLAAFCDYRWQEIESKFQKIRWDNPPTLNAWRAEVEAARRNHYSVDEGRYLSGITVIAAPVLDSSQFMTHAVVALGVSEQILQTGVATIAKELRAIAESFSASTHDRHASVHRARGPGVNGQKRRQRS